MSKGAAYSIRTSGWRYTEWRSIDQRCNRHSRKAGCAAEGNMCIWTIEALERGKYYCVADLLLATDWSAAGLIDAELYDHRATTSVGEAGRYFLHTVENANLVRKPQHAELVASLAALLRFTAENSAVEVLPPWPTHEPTQVPSSSAPSQSKTESSGSSDRSPSSRL